MFDNSHEIDRVEFKPGMALRLKDGTLTRVESVDSEGGIVVRLVVSKKIERDSVDIAWIVEYIERLRDPIDGHIIEER